MLGTALKVTGIDHVVLHVGNLDRAKKFYIDLLGFSVAHEGGRQSFLTCGSQQVALFEVRDGTELHAGSEMNHMALRLAAGEYDEVKRQLTRFTPLPHWTGQVWQASGEFPDKALGHLRLTATGGHPGNDRQHAAKLSMHNRM